MPGGGGGGSKGEESAPPCEEPEPEGRRVEEELLLFEELPLPEPGSKMPPEVSSRRTLPRLRPCTAEAEVLPRAS